MAALAQYPESAKMRCSTIDLPVVRGVGYLSDDQKREAITKQLGTESVDATDIRGLVTAAIRQDFDTTCEGHCVAGFEAVKTTPITEQPFWVNDTKLSHFCLYPPSLARVHWPSLRRAAPDFPSVCYPSIQEP